MPIPDAILGAVSLGAVLPVMQVTKTDFEQALVELKPAFGNDTESLQTFKVHGIISYGSRFEEAQGLLKKLVQQLRDTSTEAPLLSCLLEGPSGSGKSALAADVALDCGFPLVKVVSPAALVGLDERDKVAQIVKVRPAYASGCSFAAVCSLMAHPRPFPVIAAAPGHVKVFEDAYKSPTSLVVLDDIEGLLEYAAVGGATCFSNQALQVGAEWAQTASSSLPPWLRPAGHGGCKRHGCLAPWMHQLPALSEPTCASLPCRHCAC